MKPCTCGGNNSLRVAIGGIRCGCGGLLTTQQILNRIVSRLDELDEGHTDHIGALQVSGVDKCDRCGLWHNGAKMLKTHDHCVCRECLPGFFWWLEEKWAEPDETGETIEAIADDCVAFVCRWGAQNTLPRDEFKKLFGEWKAAYERFTRTNGCGPNPGEPVVCGQGEA